MKKILITGGAGFIGSHLTDFYLKEGAHVTVLDNLSTGELKNLNHAKKISSSLEFVEGDIKNPSLVRDLVRGKDLIFHFCDNGDIRFAAEHPRDYVDQNILGCFTILEAMREFGVKHIAFPSSTTVLGDTNVPAASESYGPLQPLNLYGAAKLACEGLLSGYAHSFDIRVNLFRFVDIIGDRINHGVIYDFIKKLKKNPRELEILGDGSQRRAFLLVDDCVDAVTKSLHWFDKPMNLVHVPGVDFIDISRVGELVCETMGLKDVAFRYTGGKRGWRGDSLTNHIKSDTLNAKEWRPKYDSEGAVRETVKRLIAAD